MGHHHHHKSYFGIDQELLFALAAGFFLCLGFVIETGFQSSSIALIAYALTYFFGSVFTLKEAWHNLQHKRFEVDTLMLAAAVGAAVLGQWAEGGLLLFLFSLGHSLEHYAMGRAEHAIESLADLAPDIAHVRRDNRVFDIAVDELTIGDIILIRPNERLPADGFVIKGETNINQAPITGESIPQDKMPVSDVQAAREHPQRLAAQHRVYAGSINGAHTIEVEVSKTSSESTLAQVAKLVKQANIRQSKSQRFAKNFERYFVPSILIGVVLLLFAPVIIDEPFRDSFYRAMAVLVAASPCALAIAIPSAVLSGIAAAARNGVLIKGGAPLEALANLEAMAFDKTGTLTKGMPEITDIIPHSESSQEELLSVAIAVEMLSDHPIAQAMVRDGKRTLNISELTSHAEHLQNHVGLGVSADYQGQTVWIGKLELFAEKAGKPLSDEAQQAVEPLRQRGRTIFAVRMGERDLGVIGVMDSPREHASEAIQLLRDIGIARLMMLSGDNQMVAEAVAKEVGLDEATGDLMPEDKLAEIAKIAKQQTIAMVGDGVNDAPAMANATIGIAMGAASSATALETADVALMSEDLRHIAFAVGLSRKSRQIIVQNLWLSLGMVALLVPATLLGLGIGSAIIFHEGSTLLVVFNALRLLAYKHQ